ncbi:hypothetical protein BKA24_002122 [Microbacterium marinum]|uniref:Uncharacterized protein n=1 Tax=Microbacterium marinum TaxID=421115 RepID=A0A7W7BTK7_9MICO|nr:hypothetical protein [Microbacterium marinum]MBB4667413.1 hypothetical protein [Microbacterium marinum]
MPVSSRSPICVTKVTNKPVEIVGLAQGAFARRKEEIIGVVDVGRQPTLQDGLGEVRDVDGSLLTLSLGLRFPDRPVLPRRTHRALDTDLPSPIRDHDDVLTPQRKRFARPHRRSEHHENQIFKELDVRRRTAATPRVGATPGTNEVQHAHDLIEFEI